MLGTLINTFAILLGGGIGLFIKDGIKEKYKTIIMEGVSLAVLFIGAVGAIKGLLDPQSHPILFIISLAIGGIIGEWIDIQGKLQKSGDFFQKKIGRNSGLISQGFVSASLIFCVGTMAILGAFESGLQGNHNTLFVKSILDGITSLILASTLGFGVLLSALSVLLYQGSLTLLAGFVQPYITNDMMREISIVGGILIFSLGLTMLDIKKIKTGNFLPAILIPVIYYLPMVQKVFHWISSYF